VDFPEPEGPTMERNSPFLTARSTPRSLHVTFPPVDLVQFVDLDDAGLIASACYS
jgi:hypothetical protein